MIHIIHYYKSIVDGVMTSLIDLFFNLREYFDVKFFIICPELFYLPKNDFYDFPLDQTEFITIDGKHLEFKEFDERSKIGNDVTCSIPFLKYNKNFGDPRLFFSVIVGDHKNLGSRITICSTRLLYEKLMGRMNLKFRMGCGNLLILDSLDLYKSEVKKIPNLEIAIPKNLNNCFYFGNPAIPKKSKIEYYHKFSKLRLDTLNPKSIEYKRSSKEKIKIADHYFENIGKNIFESLYHGKRVDYYSDGMTIKDGLYYYLKLFGIDGSKDHLPLKITKEDIEDKLFMKEDDKIIQVIRNLL